MRKATLLLPARHPLLGARHRAGRPDGPTFNRRSCASSANCQSCHHPDDIAPFSLMTYQDAVLHADAIKFMTQTHQMPPWKAAPGCGDFVERALGQNDIDTIAHWVDSGAGREDRGLAGRQDLRRRMAGWIARCRPVDAEGIHTAGRRR